MGVFGNILLSLSGGGYRAAAFHLGTLEALNEFGLLTDVTALSTVSGGSIAGAFYAASLENDDFPDFRSRFERFLLGTNAVEDSLDQLLTEPGVSMRSQMPSLIRSAANVYNKDELLAGKTFGHVAKAPGHLKELVVNATEFTNGGGFRFVYSNDPNIRSGNNHLPVDQDVVMDIRLADAVAASACFPGGFEPLRFPSDLCWPAGTSIDKLRQKLGEGFSKEIALMDGGIFDNQGIDSIKNIAERKKADFGLYIVSDTSPRNLSPFGFDESADQGGITLRMVRWLLVLFAALSATSAFAIFIERDPRTVINSSSISWAVFTYFFPIVVLAALFILIVISIRRIDQLIGYVQTKTGIDVWRYFGRMSLRQAISFIKSRTDSVMEMSTNIFMTRIRLLGYKLVFADPKNTGKILPNIIYDIDNEEHWGKEIKGTEYEPKENIRDRVCRAESYSTNLWFVDNADLDNLIYCGRATMTFKLLRHMLRYKNAEVQIAGSVEKELFNRLSDKWQEFNK